MLLCIITHTFTQNKTPNNKSIEQNSCDSERAEYYSDRCVVPKWHSNHLRPVDIVNVVGQNVVSFVFSITN